MARLRVDSYSRAYEPINPPLTRFRQLTDRKASVGGICGHRRVRSGGEIILSQPERNLC